MDKQADLNDIHLCDAICTNHKHTHIPIEYDTQIE